MDASRSGGAVPGPSPIGSPDPPPSIVTEQDKLPVENLIYSSYHYVVFILTNYGWFVLLATVVLALVWTSIKPSILRWLKRREERMEEENFDPVKAEKYQDAMLKSREKMQRDLEIKAQEHQEKMEAKESIEREDRIKQWEEFKVVTKTRVAKSKFDSREYFPMGGSGGGGGGGGGGYRPQRRTLNRGGGGGG